jgi:hypothetical protein
MASRVRLAFTAACRGRALCLPTCRAHAARTLNDGAQKAPFALPFPPTRSKCWSHAVKTTGRRRLWPFALRRQQPLALMLEGAEGCVRGQDLNLRNVARNVAFGSNWFAACDRNGRSWRSSSVAGPTGNERSGSALTRSPRHRRTRVSCALPPSVASPQAGLKCAEGRRPSSAKLLILTAS